VNSASTGRASLKTMPDTLPFQPERPRARLSLLRLTLAAFSVGSYGRMGLTIPLRPFCCA
jgi:hypothetical protein